MNGECVSYRMGDPLTWDEFKTWPEEHQKTYITQVIEKYKVPNTELAKAMGTEEYRLRQYIKCLGICRGKSSAAAGRYWHDSPDAVRFWAWWNGEDTSKIVETPNLRKPMSWGTFKAMPDYLQAQYIKWIRDYFGAPDKWIGTALFKVSQKTISAYMIALGISDNKGHGRKKWEKESFLAWCTGVDATASKELVKGEADVTDISEAAELVEATVENTFVEPVEDVREDFDDGVEPMTMPEIGDDPITQAFEKACHNIDAAEVALKDLEINAPDVSPIAFTGHHMPVIPKSGSLEFGCNNADDALETIKCLLSNVRVNLHISWEVVSYTEGGRHRD